MAGMLHYLAIHAVGEPVAATALLNGFPAIDQEVQGNGIWQVIADLHGCGANNRLALRLTGAPGARVRIWLKGYELGGYVAPEDGTPVVLTPEDPSWPRPAEDGVLTITLPETGAAHGVWRGALPGPDFSGLYYGPPGPEEATALQGATALLSAFRGGDVNTIIRAMEGKLRDSALVFGGKVEEDAAEWAEALRIASTAPIPAAEGEKITLHPWCDGRLIEARLDGRPLIRSRETETTMEIEMPVFLGMRGGRMQVLR